MNKNTKRNFELLLQKWESIKLNMDSDDLKVENSRQVLRSSDYVNKSEYYNIDLKDTSLAMKNIYDFVSSTMGWIHCNPSKEETKKLSQEAFIFSETNMKGERVEQLPGEVFQKFINTKQGMDNFFDDLTSHGNEGKKIIIKGKKGSGKTYTQNYFLNHYTEKLFNKKLTWFRIDFTKILRYQRRYTKKIFLHEYLYAQIVYVYFRYSHIKTDPILSSINEEELYVSAKKHYEANYEKNDFAIKYRKLKSDCIKSYKKNDGMNKPFQEEFSHSLASSIVDLLKQNDNNFLLFIDGIDNVDYIYNRYTDDWVEQIFRGELDNTCKPFRYILTTRDETLQYIDEYFSKQEFGDWGTEEYIQQYRIKPLTHIDVFNNFLPTLIMGDFYKYEAISKKMKEIGLDKDLLEKTDHSLLNDYYQFGLEFEKFIALAINTMYNNFEYEMGNILENMYHGSLRDILHDINHAFMYIYHYLLQNRKLHKSNYISVTQFVKDRHESGGYLLLSSLSRNGSVYKNDKNTFIPPYMLLHSFNIFNLLDLKKYTESSVKDIFLAFAILRELEESNLSLSLFKIKEKCRYLGFRNTYMIEKMDKKLLEYGLIILDMEGGRENEEGITYSRKISSRGKYAIQSIENIDILHSFSYEVYFPQSFVSERIVKVHKNNLSDYSSVQVYNVLSMLKVLQIYGKNLDINAFKNFNENTKKQLNRWVDSMSKKDDGHIEKIINKFTKFMDQYGEVEKVECNFTEDELYDMYDNNEISREVLKRRLKECGYR